MNTAEISGIQYLTPLHYFLIVMDIVAPSKISKFIPNFEVNAKSPARIQLIEQTGIINEEYPVAVRAF